jgi:hypothetical protein
LTQYYDAAHFDRKNFKCQMEMINHCLPIRLAAMHYCYGSRKSALDLVLPSMKLLMGQDLRQRLCLHIGSGQTIADNLEAYGITQVHETIGGPVKSSSAWINQRIQNERLNAKPVPTSPAKKVQAFATGESSQPSCSLEDRKPRKSQWNRAA